jgi:Tannase and feruloyl esterase
MRIRLGVVVASSVIWGGLDGRSQTTARPMTCMALEGLTIPASEIGLPTTGATVVSATLVPASDQRVQGAQVILAIPEYCKVNGYISPVDPAAPNINFQANLPVAWNHKAAQMGGSGLNGSIPVSLTTSMQWGPESIPPDAPYALSRGFAVYGSDSGHQSGGRGAAPGGAQADWTMNTEALTNFAYAQMKKTHDVTFAIAGRFYGERPRHSYYLGSSQGGREALMVAQRFPQDYDGIFCQVPVFPQLYWNTFEPLFRAQLQAGDGWLPPAKVPVIAREVLRQCDALDGLADGLVSAYTVCNNKFDPSISPKAWAAVRCPAGSDTGETCLSDAQVRSVQAIHGRVTFPFPLHKGWTSFPGWTTGGEGPGNWKTLTTKPDASNVAAPWVKTVIANDPALNLLAFKPETYKSKIQELSALLDAVDPDLSAFQRRGGKLILKVNSTDYTANPRWSYEYYEKVAKTMGPRATDDFLRFYVAIGIFHNRNVGRNPLTGETVPNYLDFISLLDDWVDAGNVPADRQVLRDMEAVPPFTVRASFPMCRYPSFPRYKGQGDPKHAENYTCSSR